LVVLTGSHLLSDDAVVGGAAAGSSLSSAPEDSTVPDQHWMAGGRFAASSTESGWKTRLQLASLTRVLAAAGFSASHREYVSKQSARHAPNRPAVIPLLI
jgi:hypothetical protein